MIQVIRRHEVEISGVKWSHSKKGRNYIAQGELLTSDELFHSIVSC